MTIARVVRIFAFGVAVAGFAPVAVAQSSTARVLGFRGSSASAIFRSTEGCTATEVDVIAGESIGSSPGQPSGPQAAAIVLIDRRNACTGELLVFGGAAGFGIDFAVGPRLETAEVHGIVPVPDLVSGRTLDLAVDVTWSAVGDLERGADHAHYVDDGVVVKTHSNGSFRYGQAVGRVTDGTTEFVPAGSAGTGLLSWSNYGQIVLGGGA